MANPIRFVFHIRVLIQKLVSNSDSIVRSTIPIRSDIRPNSGQHDCFLSIHAGQRLENILLIHLLDVTLPWDRFRIPNLTSLPIVTTQGDYGYEVFMNSAESHFKNVIHKMIQGRIKRL